MPRMSFAAAVVSWLVLVSGAAVVLAGPASAAPRLPDLVVGKVNVKGALVVGARVKVVEVTRNRGRAVARRSVTGYFLSKNKKLDKSDVKVGQRKVGRLRPGRKSKGAVRLTVPKRVKPGRYHLLVCADATKKVRERNERNNCRPARKKKYAVKAASGSTATSAEIRKVRVRGTVTSEIDYTSHSRDETTDSVISIDGTGTLHLFDGKPFIFQVESGGTVRITATDLIRTPDGCSTFEGEYAGFGEEILNKPLWVSIAWPRPQIGLREGSFDLDLNHLPVHRPMKYEHACGGEVREVGTWFPAMHVGNSAGNRGMTHTATLDATGTRLDFTMRQVFGGTNSDGPWQDDEKITGRLTLTPIK